MMFAQRERERERGNGAVVRVCVHTWHAPRFNTMLLFQPQLSFCPGTALDIAVRQAPLVCKLMMNLTHF